MEHDVCDATPNMSLVKMVPKVTEVFARSLFVKLEHVVDHRIYEANEHHRAEFKSVGIFTVEVYLVDVEGMDKNINAMYECAKEMDMLGIRVPVEFYQISHYFAVEKLDFFRFGYDFH